MSQVSESQIRQRPQPSEKGDKSPSPFPGQGRNLSRCVTQIRELAVKSKSHVEIHVIVNKPVSRFPRQASEIIAGGKNEGKSRDVIENKWWKNVRFFASLSMLMKINDLFLFSRDIDENKGC